MNDGPLGSTQQALEALLETLEAVANAPQLEPSDDHRAGWRVVSAEGDTSDFAERPKRRTKHRNLAPHATTAPRANDAMAGQSERILAAVERLGAESSASSRATVPASASLLAADFAGRTTTAPVVNGPLINAPLNLASTTSPSGVVDGVRGHSLDRELARLIAAWPTLSVEVRTALVAMVDAAHERRVR